MKIPPKGTYKVTAHMEYGIAQLYHLTYYYRWYWQANLRSWFLHHVLGYSCNTWKRNDAA